MIFQHFQLDHLRLHAYHLAPRLHLAIHGKLFPPIIVLMEHLLEFKTNTTTLLSIIEFVLVREVHDETNLTCISKTFEQTAFGPGQSSLFISLCLEFNGKRRESHDFFDFMLSYLFF